MIHDFVAGSIWDKVFKSGPSEICGRQPLKKLKGYAMLKQSSTNFTWSTLEFFVPMIIFVVFEIENIVFVCNNVPSEKPLACYCSFFFRKYFFTS